MLTAGPARCVELRLQPLEAALDAELIASGTDAEALSRAAIETRQIADTPGTDSDAFVLIGSAPPPQGRQRVFRTADGRWIEARESTIDHGGQICIHIDVAEASDAAAALAILRGGAHIDLLLTDVVMPGLLQAGVAPDFPG